MTNYFLIHLLLWLTCMSNSPSSVQAAISFPPTSTTNQMGPLPASPTTTAPPIDYTALNSHLKTLLLGGAITEDWWNSYKGEVDKLSPDYRQTLFNHTIQTVFSSSTNDDCEIQMQCKDSLYFANNQLLVINWAATTLARSNISLPNTNSLFRENGDEVEIRIQKNITDISRVSYPSNINSIVASNVMSAVFMTYKPSDNVHVQRMYSTVTASGSEMDGDVVGVLLFDNSSSIINNLEVTLVFTYPFTIDDDKKAACVAWDFQRMEWDNTKCGEANISGSDGRLVSCACRSIGHFAVLLSPKVPTVDPRIQQMISNLQNHTVDEIMQEINDYITTQPSPITSIKLILEDVSKSYERNLHSRRENFENFGSNIMRLTDALGYLLSNYTTGNIFSFETAKINMAINRNTNPRDVTKLKTNSGMSNVRFPSDINTIDPMWSAPVSLVIHYQDIGNALFALHPSLMQDSRLNSDVIGVSIISPVNKWLRLKNDNITVTLLHKQPLTSGFITICVSWNYNQSHWDPEGCTLAPGSNSTLSTCSCNLLAPFALLMSSDIIPIRTQFNGNIKQHLLFTLVTGVTDDDIRNMSLSYGLYKISPYDRQKYYEEFMKIVFSDEARSRCEAVSKCKNSYEFESNCLFAMERTAALFLQANLTLPESISRFLLDEEIDITIQRNLASISNIQYPADVTNISANTATSAIFLWYNSKNNVNFGKLYLVPPYNNSTVAKEIIGVMLYDKYLNIINDSTITFQFQLEFVLDLDKTVVCSKWDFGQLAWNTSSCSSRYAYDSGQATCECQGAGHYAAFKVDNHGMLPKVDDSIFQTINHKLENTSVTDLIKSIEQDIKTQPNPKKYINLVLNAVDEKFQESLKSTSRDNEKLAKNVLRLTENLGFILLKFWKGEDFIVETKTSYMNATGDVFKGGITSYNSSSGLLTVRIPAVAIRFPQLPRSVMTYYRNIGDALKTLSPQLTPNSTVNSDVVGISIRSVTSNTSQISLATDNITIALPHKQPLAYGFKSICVFWNVTHDYWDPQGCILAEGSNSTFSICSCNHFTEFALLSSSYPTNVTQDASNLASVPLNNLTEKIDQAFLNSTDPEEVGREILTAVSSNFRESDETPVENYNEIVSKAMQIVEHVGFQILDHLVGDNITLTTNISTVTILRSISPGFIAEFDNMPDLSIQFPADLNSSWTGLNSTPAILHHFRNIGSHLNATSPTLPQTSSVNSQLIGAAILRYPIRLKGGNVTITLPHTQPLYNNSTSVCVFWNFNATYWDSEGCTLTADSNSTISICSCNHLTTFAVLISFLDTEHEPDSVLDVITVIGCIISIISLITCIGWFSAVKALRGTRTTIHINLCACLLVGNIAIVTSVFYESWREPEEEEEEEEVESGSMCLALAVLLHYFYLASFMWMASEGYHIYQSLVRVFKRSIPLRWLFVVSYGVPFVTVGATTLAVTLKGDDHDEKFQNDSCWISTSDSGYVWTFLSFVIITLLFNVVMAVVSLKSVSIGPQRVRRSEDGKVKKFFWQATVLHPLLGFPWILGFIQLSSVDETLGTVFTYISTLTISLQGFLIFYFHCYRNKHVRAVVSEYLTCFEGLSATDSSPESRVPLNCYPNSELNARIVRTPPKANT